MIEKPLAYGTFHILFVLIGGAASVLIAWKLRNVGEKGNRRVLLSVGFFLLISEIYKQLLYYFYFGNGSYQWHVLPFQLCSVPMYLCIIAAFLKPGTVRQSMYNFMTYFNLMGGAISFAEPSGLLNKHLTLMLHSFTWHMLLVFVGLYLGFSGRGGRTLRDFRLALYTFLGLCVFAFSLNVLLWDVSEGAVNMFYIGPAITPIAVFKDFAAKYGWYISTLLYIPCVCFAAFLVFLPFHMSDKYRSKRKPNTALVGH